MYYYLFLLVYNVFSRCFKGNDSLNIIFKYTLVHYFQLSNIWKNMEQGRQHYTWIEKLREGLRPILDEENLTMMTMIIFFYSPTPLRFDRKLIQSVYKCGSGANYE